MDIPTLIFVISGYCAALPNNCILVNSNTIHICNEAFPEKLTKYQFVREDKPLTIYVGRCPQT